ncbi:class I SAM-dependent methyltransferase [Streptomyces sp. SID11385]|uniref:class I SAM-dependent methyltransferase n=1 Tax=Streptomyces sp. SID11385 TaxID=2706031 RepID=UPI0013CD2D0B|nr:class I SAM-dependent methyltransferase [Streptomyces sp. SID11385]NEA40029.1 class I SAM-dependent methyltransferase [Streptomyces sp. SID11385]
MTPEALAALMAGHAYSPAAQLRQTAHRQALAAHWQPRPGARLLEIGCGQGDTTAVLADLVGPTGHVLATDPGPPAHGAPVTLGDSLRHLASGPLGDRVETRLGFDLASAPPEPGFDAVVLSHCSWYVADAARLRHLLARARAWAPVLHLAEWDPEPTAPGQLAHLLAVRLQAHLVGAGLRGDGNIRTPFSRPQLLRLLAETGWQAGPVSHVPTEGLQDADWEIDAAAYWLAEARAQGTPAPHVLDLAESEADVLAACARTEGNACLPAWTVTATG